MTIVTAIGDVIIVGVAAVASVASPPPSSRPGSDHVDMLQRIAATLGFSADRDLEWVPQKDGAARLCAESARRVANTPWSDGIFRTS